MRSVTVLLLTSNAILFLTGCNQGVTEYRADSSGRLHPVAHYRDLWESAVEGRIQQEIRGAPPPGHNKTWPQFWRRWYESLGHEPDGAKRIEQARALRRAHALDPY
jgi:hypothetical protein